MVIKAISTVPEKEIPSVIEGLTPAEHDVCTRAPHDISFVHVTSANCTRMRAFAHDCALVVRGRGREGYACRPFCSPASCPHHPTLARECDVGLSALQVLMKYLYRGLEGTECNAQLLRWHCALTEKAGMGCIMRALQPANRV